MQTLSLWLNSLFHRLVENELSRRIIKNVGYLFSSTGISAAISMLQGILAARLLGVADFGILGAITVFTSVINNLVSFRMSELVVRYVGKYTVEGETSKAAAVFKLAALVEMLASIIAFGLVCILAPVGAKFFAKDVALSGLFIFYGFILLANLIAESSIGLLQIFDKFRNIAAVNVLQSLVTLAVIVVVYFSQGDLLGILLAYLCGKFVGALGLTSIALVEATRRWGKWWLSPISQLRAHFKELTNFAISSNFSASISLVTKDSEILWVSFFRNPVETGFYKLALALSNMVQLPINPMPQATYPELSREVASHNWMNVRYVLRQGSILAGAYTLAVTIFLLLFGKSLISWLYGPEFLEAFPALMVLLIGFLVANTFYWRRIALLALGQPGFPARLNFVLAAIKVLGIIILVPRYGFIASAALLSAFYWAGSILSVLKIRSTLIQQEQLYP